MGTRAAFYIGRGATAEWIGSIAWDGYPSGITPKADEETPRERILGGGTEHKDIDWPEGAHLFSATTEAEYRERVARFFLYRNDVTLPEHGWPWPWDDSCTTDYAYALDDGVVYASCFGSSWWVASAEEPDDTDDMKGPKATFPTLGGKEKYSAPAGSAASGIMVFGVPSSPVSGGRE